MQLYGGRFRNIRIEPLSQILCIICVDAGIVRSARDGDECKSLLDEATLGISVDMGQN